MKMSKILLVFMIGLISLNVIFAGTTSKTFLIKGDLAINSNLTSRCGLGLDWGQSPEDVDATQINQTGGGQALSKAKVSDTLYFGLAANSICKLEIYTPNNTTTPIYSKSNLNASAIKFGLNQGIVIGPVTITSTEQTINFIVKVKGQNTSNQYTDELLTTTIRVPNPNSEDTVVAADTAEYAERAAEADYAYDGPSGTGNGSSLIEGTSSPCTATNDREIKNINGTLMQCDYQSGWRILLGSNSIFSYYIVDNAISSDKIINDAITSDKIANSVITSDKIANNAIISSKIANNAITADKILNNEITLEKLNLEVLGRIGNVISAPSTWTNSYLEENFNQNDFIEINKDGIIYIVKAFRTPGSISQVRVGYKNAYSYSEPTNFIEVGNASRLNTHSYKKLEITGNNFTTGNNITLRYNVKYNSNNGYMGWQTATANIPVTSTNNTIQLTNFSGFNISESGIQEPPFHSNNLGVSKMKVKACYGGVNNTTTSCTGEFTYDIYKSFTNATGKADIETRFVSSGGDLDEKYVASNQIWTENNASGLSCDLRICTGNNAGENKTLKLANCNKNSAALVVKGGSDDYVYNLTYISPTIPPYQNGCNGSSFSINDDTWMDWMDNSLYRININNAKLTTDSATINNYVNYCLGLSQAACISAFKTAGIYLCTSHFDSKLNISTSAAGLRNSRFVPINNVHIVGPTDPNYSSLCS